MKELVLKKYKDVLEAAMEGEQRCFQGKRWDGQAILIVVDAALDSIGLNYFQIVVPRVRCFYEDYVKTSQIASLEDLSKLTPQDMRLRKIMNNGRAWRAAIGICRALNQIRIKNGLESDFAALRFWAEKASLEDWKRDTIGKIHGVGLITFQYLRMQAGVDTTMPDKIIKKTVERDFGVKAEDDLQFIKEMETFSKETGYSQIFLCWMIWLKESDIKTSGWERID